MVPTFLLMLFIYIVGYSIIAVNTTVDCSLMEVSSNRKKRKIAECNDEVNEGKEWIPIPKSTNCVSFKH